MKHLRIVLAPLLVFVLATAASAERLSLAAISDYLNSLTSAEAEFTQVNDDGTISTGRIFINRPGRIRFEYNPPDASLVMAGSGEVVIFDNKSNATPERFPLASTPLAIILKPTVNLGQARMVVGHTSDATTTTVTAQDPDHPEYGNIQLVFTDNPVELRQWIVTDAADQQTTVILGELKTGGTLSPRMFDIRGELEKRGF
ncbi:MAG: outer membrane lipoprotein carrier protein LolA [Paracoccaceae bacterium]